MMTDLTIVPGSTVTLTVIPPVPPPALPTLQQQLDAGGIVELPAGEITADVLTITKDVILRGAGQETTVLKCEGIQVSSAIPNHYTVFGIENLTIKQNGTGDIGLSLKDCRTTALNVQIADFAVNGLKIDGGIGSRFENVIAVRSPIPCLVSGSMSTTLVFSRCSFTQASDTACKVEGAINSIAFTDWTVFETAKRGLVIDGCDVITMSDCYFENVSDEQIIIGETAQCMSVIVRNPIMTGSSNLLTDTTRFDRVRSLVWEGGVLQGMSAKLSLIRTTTNTGNVFMVEPLAGVPGVGFVFAKPELVTIAGASGHLKARQLDINAWNLQSTWSWVQNDLCLFTGNKFALYAAPAGNVRLAAVNNSGVLSGGVEATNAGLVLRSPDGSRWQQTIDNAGLTTWVKL